MTDRMIIILLLVWIGISGVQAGETYIHNPEPDIALGCGFFDDIPNPVDLTRWRWNLSGEYFNITEATLTFRIYDDGDNETDRVKFSVSDWLWGSETNLGMHELAPFTGETLSYNVTEVLQSRLFIQVTVMCLGGPDLYFDWAELHVEGTPRGDTDGVSDATENMVPNAGGEGTGDGNGDGIPDSGQDHVASLPSHPSAPVEAYATVVCQESYALLDVRSLPATDPPEGWDFPYGALSLEVDGIPPGEAVTLMAMIPTDVDVTGILKKDHEGEWQVVSRDVLHGPPEAPTKTVLSFQLVDGGTFDEDGQVDGALSDDMYIGIEVTEASCLLGLVSLPLIHAIFGGHLAPFDRRRGKAGHV